MKSEVAILKEDLKLKYTTQGYSEFAGDDYSDHKDIDNDFQRSLQKSPIGNNAVVAGGFNNTAVGTVSVVNGGSNNVAFNTADVVGGGKKHIASGTSTVIGGGGKNLVLDT